MQILNYYQKLLGLFRVVDFCVCSYFILLASSLFYALSFQNFGRYCAANFEGVTTNTAGHVVPFSGFAALADAYTEVTLILNVFGNSGDRYGNITLVGPKVIKKTIDQLLGQFNDASAGVRPTVVDVRASYCGAFYKNFNTDSGFDMICFGTLFQQVNSLKRYLCLFFTDLLRVALGRQPIHHTVPNFYMDRLLSLRWLFYRFDLEGDKTDIYGGSYEIGRPFHKFRLLGFPRPTPAIHIRVEDEEEDDAPLAEYDSDTSLDKVVLYEE